MTVSLKHKFTNPKADSASTTITKPSHWNDEHDLTLTGPALLGKDDAGAGDAEEIAIGSGLTLSAGTLAAEVDDTDLAATNAAIVATNAVIATLRTPFSANTTFYVRYAVGTCTISNASPAVVTIAAHALQIDDAVVFATTGTLPTGLTPGVIYYIISAGFAAGSFRVSTSVGGSAVNTSGAGSGTHTLTSGSDSNNGLAATRTGAKLTLYATYYDIADNYDLAGYAATIQLTKGVFGSTSFPGALYIERPIVGGFLTIQGDSRSTTILSDMGSGYNFIVAGVAVYMRLLKMKFTSTAGACIGLYGAGTVFWDDMEFGSCPGFPQIDLTTQMVMENSPKSAGLTISGSTARFLNCANGGVFYLDGGVTVTLTGTPAWSSQFVYAWDNSVIHIDSGIVFSGSATGSRFACDTGGQINTFGAATTFFPGNAVGTEGTGSFGKYS